MTTEACDRCGCCVGVCPDDALAIARDALAISAERCGGCAHCAWVCPFEALRMQPREDAHA